MLQMLLGEPSRQTIGSEDPSVEILGHSQDKKITMTNLEILCDFTNQTLEREFTNEKLRRLLVTTDFTKSDSSRPETMRLLHTTSGCLGCCEQAVANNKNKLLTAVLRAADLAANCLRGALPRKI